MKQPLMTTLFLLGWAPMAFAHGGVEDPQVLARMEGMKRLGTEMKLLSTMAKGERDFEAEKVRRAITRIEAEAGQIPVLFEPEAQDPKSEAHPSIWDEFHDFRGQAQALEEAANSLSEPIESRQALGPALVKLGVTCKECHDEYRE
ncbi:c-type cytochrome [Thioclava electrotropha]|jgi:cytochrome c556|uniref:c-type cytochrome n=1 Tax=Thioclava electrotropha TaxID=1549850 RepID=UPI0023A86922|nr:cytochrome c [Thioclava electrotropha]